MAPLVSILIPAHNAEKWIADTIRAAIAQTWEPKEIVVVDDGSTDRTRNIAEQFASPRVCVVTQENQGASAARNRAFSLSRGDYIQWLDADDLLAPCKVSKQLMAVDSKVGARTLLSSAWGQFLSRPRRARFVPSALWCDLSPREFLLRKMEHKIFMASCAWLVSRQLTEEAGPWDTSLSFDDDGEYFSRVLLASHGVKFVPEAKAYYRAVGTTGVSHIGKSSEKQNAQWRSMELHIRYLRGLDDNERVRSACLTYLQNYVVDFYPRRLDIIAQMHQVAQELGAHLERPQLSWKYAWIAPILGWDHAQRAQLCLPTLKWGAIRACDKALLALEKQVARRHRGNAICGESCFCDAK